MIKHVVLFNVKTGTSQKQFDAMVAGYNCHERRNTGIDELVDGSKPAFRRRVLSRHGRCGREHGNVEMLRGSRPSPASVNGAWPPRFLRNGL